MNAVNSFTHEGIMTNNKFKKNLLNKASAFVCIFAISTSFFGSLSYAQQMPLAEGVSAIVNDEPITSFDVRQRTRYLLIRQNISQPTNEIIAQAAEQAINSLINERLQLQEAKKFKLKMSDEEVDRVLEKQAKQGGATLEELFADLRANGLSIQSYRDTTRAEMLWQRIVVGRYGNRVKISPDRVKEAMERIQNSANKKQYQVSEIFIETPSAAEEAQTLEGVKTLVGKLRAGENFRAIAEIYSFAPSAATGGNLGWVLQGELRPEVGAMIDGLEIGQISDPIKVQGGFMIIAVNSKHEGKSVSTTYGLKEFSKSIPENADETAIKKAEAQLLAARNQYKGNCDAAQNAAKANSVQYTDLGNIQDSDLADELLSKITNLKKGQATDIVKFGNEMTVTIVCTKSVSGDNIPTAEQIEDSMHDQELALIARRYLRDIRREAAIVKR